MRRASLLAAALGLAMASSIAVAPVEAATHYANCKALHAQYPHGVGLPNAHDHTSGIPVTNFKRSTTLYNANKSLDRDHDKIACEKH